MDLLMDIAFKFPPDAPKNRKFVLGEVMKDRVGVVQLTESLKYFKKIKDAPFDVSAWEKECGVGFVMSDEEIRKVLEEIIEEHKSELGAEPHKNGMIWKFIKAKMPFAAPSDVKNVLNSLGTKEKDSTRGEIAFPRPEDNVQLDPKLLAEHLKATGGKVVTRFPPEPNGYLHIGHAKSMHLNFGYAKRNEGICYMRFDDTNPETESTEYVNAIKEAVLWMGHKWDHLTYASDYFQQLYELAVELIKRGKAYVCHLTPEEIDEYRKQHKDSPWRNRTVEENLKLFNDMKVGKFEEGKATLRMKMDMQSTVSVMWDLVAYRIKYHHHHRSGDQWCIYPSYDFTHCLNDTLENITHSLCTLEFVDRRVSYNWLVDSLGLYRSVVWEYARLELTHTILSKRKLIKLVNEKYVKGWDDPRLPTIFGLRRRGYSSEGINNFCADIRVTRHNSLIPYEKLEEFVRQDLNKTSTRAFALLNPLKVTLRGWKKGNIEVKCLNVPGNEAKGYHTIPFGETFYIEQSDFKEVDEPDFYGLAFKSETPKVVKLKYVDLDIMVVDVNKDKNGLVTDIVVEIDPKSSGKHAIHWISPEPGKELRKAEIRNYSHLFLSDEPIKTFGEKWLEDINPNSLEVREAFVDSSCFLFRPFDRIQFERVGYYCVDPDSTPEKLVFNRTVTLKESKWKKAQE
uniref:glutamine--tRNA ligase n=1 Tax=Arcella intermedia TaxID=1963864 RepID=A0A6B2KYY2_9EUKA